MLEFDIYPGHANRVDLILYDNGLPLPNHTAITRVKIYVGSTAYDSQTNPELFDLTNTDHIEFLPGAITPEIAQGDYVCRFLIYNALDYADGYVWPEGFIIHVRPEPVPI